MSRTPKVAQTDRTGTDLADVAQGEERRRDRRYGAEGQVLVYWQSRYGRPQESAAILRNASAGGFAIELGESFPVGAVVVIKASERSLQCMVRHVQELSDSFLIGLEVLSASDGSTLARALDGLSSGLSDSIPE
jgi:hypothetical protein